MIPTLPLLRAGLAVACVAVTALPATAQIFDDNRVVLGVGASDFTSDGAGDPITFDGEYHFRRRDVGQDFNWGFAAGALITGNADVWIGAGLSAEYEITDNWFLEGSVLPGLYEEDSDAADLGLTFEIRSLLGVGRKLTDNSALSLSISHISNASLGDDNPGVNFYSLRYHFGF